MSNENLNVDEIILFEDEVAVTAEVDVPPALETPCLVVTNVMLREELMYLRDKPCDQESSINLYVEFEGEHTKIGLFDVSLDNLLILDSLGYDMRLYLPEGTKIELNSVDILMNFMRL